MRAARDFSAHVLGTYINIRTRGSGADVDCRRTNNSNRFFRRFFLFFFNNYYDFRIRNGLKKKKKNPRTRTTVAERNV